MSTSRLNGETDRITGDAIDESLVPFETNATDFGSSQWLDAVAIAHLERLKSRFRNSTLFKERQAFLESGLRSQVAEATRELEIFVKAARLHLAQRHLEEQLSGNSPLPDTGGILSWPTSADLNTQLINSARAHLKDRFMPRTQSLVDVQFVKVASALQVLDAPLERATELALMSVQEGEILRTESSNLLGGNLTADLHAAVASATQLTTTLLEAVMQFEQRLNALPQTTVTRSKEALSRFSARYARSVQLSNERLRERFFKSPAGVIFAYFKERDRDGNRPEWIDERMYKIAQGAYPGIPKKPLGDIATMLGKDEIEIAEKIFLDLRQELKDKAGQIEEKLSLTPDQAQFWVKQSEKGAIDSFCKVVESHGLEPSMAARHALRNYRLVTDNQQLEGWCRALRAYTDKHSVHFYLYTFDPARTDFDASTPERVEALAAALEEIMAKPLGRRMEKFHNLARTITERLGAIDDFDAKLEHGLVLCFGVINPFYPYHQEIHYSSAEIFRLLRRHLRVNNDAEPVIARAIKDLRAHGMLSELSGKFRLNVEGELTADSVPQQVINLIKETYSSSPPPKNSDGLPGMGKLISSYRQIEKLSDFLLAAPIVLRQDLTSITSTDPEEPQLTRLNWAEFSEILTSYLRSVGMDREFPLSNSFSFVELTNSQGALRALARKAEQIMDEDLDEISQCILA
ncbi:MAG: hypothetical protein KDD42_03895, partial [Bdellovibrionales bacterium]|nr:hypothetical protein [Bdellovibrionales bacterium]